MFIIIIIKVMSTTVCRVRALMLYHEHSGYRYDNIIGNI